MTSSDADLLAQAWALEAEAVEAGEDLPEGRELRSRAAQVRVQALADRPYPAVVCTECLHVTGWTDGDGRCDPCLRRARSHAAFTDPRAGFVGMNDMRRSRHAETSHGSRLRFRGARERAQADAWLSRVDPDATGPIAPEPGFELEAARRDEVEALDGSGMVVRFRTTTLRFEEGGWTELDTTRIPRSRFLTPSELSAGLETEDLVAAWVDYKAEVEAYNRVAWTEEAARRDADGAARRDHDETLRRQRDAAQLLDEG